MDREEVDSILELRKQARASRNWAESDKLRDKLKLVGITVVDTKDGQRATAGSEYEKNWKPCFSALVARIEILEHNIAVLNKREAYYSARIAELVKETLELKYGDRTEG